MNVKRTPSTQQCPICKTLQPLSAARCPNCGALLAGDPLTARLSATGSQLRINPPSGPIPSMRNVPTSAEDKRSTREILTTPPPGYNDGDDDLFEGSLPGLPRGLLVMGMLILLVIGAALIFVFRPDLRPGVALLTTATTTPASLDSAPAFATITPVVTNRPGQTTLRPTLPPTIAAATDLASIMTATFLSKPRATAPPTNTRPATLRSTDAPFVVPPTLDIPTITAVPPSLTPTPTRGPCVQKAKQGDTLSALAARCGHYSPAIIPVILEDNNMQDTGSLQIGQSVVIPWPTTAASAALPVNAAGATPAGPLMADAEPTLIPGQAWYTVKQGDSAITIAYKFGATIKVLRDLNPEIGNSFLQCDYGQPAGGEGCTVSLSIGQRLRVPVPLATTTPTLTPNGSETPTPTATPTFNVPFLIGPGNNMLFDVGDFPVLRWSASDRLAPNQVYLVKLVDKTINQEYRLPTTELSVALGPEYQGTDRKRHDYEWSVSVAIASGIIPQATDFTTETRTFVWQGR